MDIQKFDEAIAALNVTRLNFSAWVESATSIALDIRLTSQDRDIRQHVNGALKGVDSSAWEVNFNLIERADNNGYYNEFTALYSIDATTPDPVDPRVVSDRELPSTEYRPATIIKADMDDKDANDGN